MARKINFDLPADDGEPVQKRHEAAPQRARPLLGLERTIKHIGAPSGPYRTRWAVSPRR